MIRKKGPKKHKRPRRSLLSLRCAVCIPDFPFPLDPIHCLCPRQGSKAGVRKTEKRNGFPAAAGSMIAQKTND